MISVSGLHKSYGGIPVLRGVDLAVGRGETVVIIGPSGAGKTTLLRCLNFLSEYDSGQIHVDGKLMWFKDAACSARRPARATSRSGIYPSATCLTTQRGCEALTSFASG